MLVPCVWRTMWPWSNGDGKGNHKKTDGTQQWNNNNNNIKHKKYTQNVWRQKIGAHLGVRDDPGARSISSAYDQLCGSTAGSDPEELGWERPPWHWDMQWSPTPVPCKCVVKSCHVESLMCQMHPNAKCMFFFKQKLLRNDVKPYLHWWVPMVV